MTSSAVLFSLMAVLARIANNAQGVGAWKTAEFRFIIGILVVLAISAWQRERLRFVNRSWLASRGFFGGAAVCIFFYAISAIGLAKATIFTYTYPIWAGLLAPLILKDRITLGVWIAMLVAFIGLYLIIVPPEGLGAISWFDLLAIGGGLMSGWAILSLKKLHETDSSRTIFFSQCFFGLILVAVPAQSGGYSFPVSTWLILLGVGLLAAFAQLQMTYAYKFIGAIEGSLLSMLTPVMNVIFGVAIFHEPLSPRAMLGCAIVLVCCAYAAIPQTTQEGVSDG